MRIALAQLNCVVGDLAGNVRRVVGALASAAGRRADLLAVPELAITGYPPEDLVERRDFVDANL
ncbi:MAG: nitrilase-related carbon-nitrogen hydrolase, partial [bacterium]